MKSLTSILFHFIVISTSLFLFSCDRAAEDKKTRVILNLPNAQSISKFSSSITQLSTTTTGVISPVEDFLPPVTTTTDTVISDAGYCYLVVVQFPGAESAKNGNYCGKNQTYYTANYSIVKNNEQYQFGNFAGLLPSSKSSVDLGDIPAGKGRNFLIFGMKATSEAACQTIQLDTPIDKTLMEPPHLIGRTDNVDLSAGGSLDVSVTIDTSVNTSINYMDDCVFNGALKYPQAEYITLEQESFPYNYLRSLGSTEPLSAVCQPVTFALKAHDSNLNRDVPAALVDDGVFQLTTNQPAMTPGLTGTFDTYDNHDDCIAGTNNKLYFAFPRNKPYHKRWFKWTATDAGSIALSAQTISVPVRTDLSSYSFNYDTSATTIVDSVVPKNVQKGICYHGVTFVRDLLGNIRDPGQTLYLNPSTISNVSFYGSGANCLAGTSAVSYFTVNSGTLSQDFYFKVDPSVNEGTAFDFEFSIGPTNFKSSRQKIYVAKDDMPSNGNTIDITQVGRAEGLTKPTLPNDPNACYPLFVYINNQKGAAMAVINGNYDFRFTDFSGSSSLNFEYQNLRYQVIDKVTQLVTPTGYTIYQASAIPGSGCSGATVVDPVGTVGKLSGDYAMSVDGTFRRLYIRPDGTSTGKRKIQLYFGGSSTAAGYPVGQVEFELTNHNY